MKVPDQVIDSLRRRVLFPATSYLFNRKHVMNRYRELLKSEWYSTERIEQLQLEKLQKLISFSSQCVPFYKNKFRELGLEPPDIKSLEDIKKLPILSRLDVLESHKEMVESNYQKSISYAELRNNDPGAPLSFAPFRRHRLVRNTSSGSTGAPTVFYEDGSRTALNWAHEFRLRSWFNVEPLSREARMVRLSSLYSEKDKIIRRRKLLWGQLLLPGMNLSDPEYSVCVEKILEFKPESLWGYTPALAGLAGYLKQNPVDFGDYRLKLAIGWASPIYEHEEKILKEVFECPVTNIYGSREVGHVALKCSSGAFHINQESYLVEIEDLEERGALPGAGEILVTTLDISPMPFIRYRMGDLGRIEKSRCGCGRALEVLADLLGRTGEVFVTKDGHMISPNFWCRTFMSGKISGAVRRFQVIYKRTKDLKIIIEKGQKYTSDTENYIKEMVSNNFSPDTNLELEFVPKIESDISGKYQMVLKEDSAGRGN